mgnify:CR=1 FL=1
MIFFKIVLSLFKIFPLNKNLILFMEGSYNSFNGNCRAIYEKLKENKNYKFVLLVKNKKQVIDLPNLMISRYYSPKTFYYLATAKYCFFTTEAYKAFFKRKNQLFINLWHGAGAFKKFGMSCKYNKYIQKYNGNIVDMVSISSDKINNFYQEALGARKEKIKNLGIPRADIFFKEDEKLKVKEIFFNKYPELKKNKKIIMYAPTFRDNDKGNFKLKLDVNLMKEKLEKLGYVLFLRLHPSIKKDDISVDNIFSYDFSKYEQVSDLLIVSDILISDYSSIIFEFSIMKKPILFYSYDVEEYIKDRGFYYNYYEFIPNKINYTTEEVINSIINKEWDLERIEEFARYFFNPFDGNSTERVLKEVGLWEEEK